MRQLLFLGFLMISIAVQAQANYYSIMLGAYSAAHLTHFAAARQVGYVYSIPVEGGFQVYVGGFENDTTALAALTKLRGLGFSEARMIARQIDSRKKTSVIQLASQHYLNPIKWSRFSGLQNVQVIVQGDLVRIVMGPYENGMAAQIDLANAQANGFPDAFVKSNNPVYLHPLSEFEVQPIVAKPNPAKAIPLVAPQPSESVTTGVSDRTDVIIEKGQAAGKQNEVAVYLDKALSAAGYLRYNGTTNAATANANYVVAKQQYRQLNNYVRLSTADQMQDIAIFLMVAKDATKVILPPDAEGSNVVSVELLELTDPISASEIAETRSWHNKLIGQLANDNNYLMQIAYGGAWLRLQQHYIASGLSEKDATEVALLVLKLSTEEYLTHLTN